MRIGAWTSHGRLPYRLRRGPESNRATPCADPSTAAPAATTVGAGDLRRVPASVSSGWPGPRVGLPAARPAAHHPRVRADPARVELAAVGFGDRGAATSSDQCPAGCPLTGKRSREGEAFARKSPRWMIWRVCVRGEAFQIVCASGVRVCPRTPASRTKAPRHGPSVHRESVTALPHRHNEGQVSPYEHATGPSRTTRTPAVPPQPAPGTRHCGR